MGEEHAVCKNIRVLLKDYWQVLWWRSNDVCQLSTFYKIEKSCFCIHTSKSYYCRLYRIRWVCKRNLCIFLAMEVNCEILIYLSNQLYCIGSFWKFLTQSNMDIFLVYSFWINFVRKSLSNFFYLLWKNMLL